MSNTSRFHSNEKSNSGFTLMEAIITISIMGILAAVVTPTYLKTQTEAKLVMSQSHISQLQQGFINLYFEGLFHDEKDVWPDEPSDHKMTYDWASTTTLYDDRSVAQLFTSSNIIYNPYNHPYLYYLLPATEHEPAGFRIDCPDTGLSLGFRP